MAGKAFKAGDIAATGFAGVRLQSEILNPGVDPVSKTVLDPDGVALRIFDASTFGASASGQMLVPQTKLELKARDIGHVFALAFDPGSVDATISPSLYTAATSAFGLNIVGPDKDGDGKPDRLNKGGPGATFMEGQFGSQKGAGPGTIWKIDGATGAISVFANVETNGVANSGAGIGGLAIDPTSRTLYASDLDTGLIHRLALKQNGPDQGVFDHGLIGRPSRGKAVVKDDGARLDITSPNFDPAKPETWKYTAPERRVYGLAVHEGRLYYAVAEGSEIWSVGLDTDGAFKIDVRFEVGIGSSPSLPSTGIAFDRDGRMILAQRGNVQNPADYSQFVSADASKVLRLTPNAGNDSARWKLDVDEYAVGNAEGHRASSGGLATHYAYKPDGSIDLATCDGTLAVSADSLGEKRAVHGLQLADVALVRPANVPPNRSVYIDWDARQDDPLVRGYAGGVASFQDCQGGGGFPAVADGGAGLPPIADGGGGAFPPVDGGGGAVAPPIDETLPPIEGGGGGKTLPLQVVKTADVTTCSPKGGCAFSITVTNPNAEDVAGPIVIDEQIDAQQATLTGEPNAPWTCTKAAPFTCTHPGPIPANAAVDMRVVFAPNTPPEIKTVKNCAVVQGAAAALPEQCPTIALDPDAPVQTGPIIVSKKSTSACTAKGPCTFTITVTNNSDAEVKGPIIIDEQIDAPQAVPVDAQPNAPWTCEKAAPFSCTHPGPFAAKQSADLILSFIPNTPPETTSLKNCAIVRQPPPVAPAKQLEPDKKTEAPLPFGGNPLIEHASFNVLSSGRKQSLFHLMGGAGGTIGGVSCVKRRAPPAFSIRQANGFDITLDNVSSEVGGKFTGNARIFDGKSGPFSGAFHGVFLYFTIHWTDGSEGSYRGTFDAAGNLSGTTRAKGVTEVVPFKGLQPWPCGETNACRDYADKAMAQVGEFQKLQCGPLPLQMSANRADHVNFCMGTHDTPIEGEHETRDQQIAACKERIAAAAVPPPPAPPPFVPVTKLKIKPPPEPGAAPAPEQCATVPIGPPVVADNQPPPPVVPLTPSKLVLAKNPVASQCSDAGGGCDFMISITNPGPEEFNGPIEFTDDATAGDGKPFLNLTMLGGQAIGEPGVSASMSCVRAGAGFKCSTAPNFPAKIAAGKTVRIPMSFKPGGGTGATSIKNCAQLTGSADKSCVNIPLVTGQLLRVLKQGGGFTCVPDCTFSISVQNVGTEEARGLFAFDDVFTPGGEAASFTVIDGDFKCAKVDAKARCVSSRPFLKPGESSTVRLKVSGVAKAPQYQNCAELAESSGFAILKDFPGRCVTITDTTPPPPPDEVGPTPKLLEPNLTVTKRSIDNLPILGNKVPCTVKGPCPFEISVSNTGKGTFVGPIIILDSITERDPQRMEQAAGGAWKCTPISNGTVASCSHDTVTIPPGGPPITLLMMVTPGPAWKKNDTLTNCASLAFPLAEPKLGNDPGTKNDDDKGCATVKLDPFAVSVEKSGGQNCQPGGDCKFTISVFNPGPIDHIAPVKITDQLTGISSAPIVSIAPKTGDSFPCNPAPTQIPFTCTSPGNYPLILGPNGESSPPKVFDMVVKLPPDAKAFTNCAAALDPTSGSPAPGTKPSCVSVSTTPAALPIESSKCSGGMVLNAAGACACPPDTTFNGRSCSGGGSNGVQPPPVVVRPPSVVVVPPPPVGCLGGMVLTAGACSCPPGSRFSGRACVDDGSGGSNTAKSSEDDDTSPPPVKTRPLKVEDPVCPRSRPVGDYPDCCPRGTRFRNGVCRPNRQEDPPPVIKPKKPEPPECPRSRPVGDYPNCCPDGTRFRRGACRPDRQEKVPPPQPNCPASRPVGDYPNCCPNGMKFIGGACRRLGIPQPSPQQNVKTCPDGTKVFGKFTPCPSVRPRPQPQPSPTPQLNVKTCPDGTKVFGKYTRCPSVKPRPTPQPAPPQPPKQCQFGLPPSCTCPPGKDPVQGGCRSSVR